MGQGRAGGRGRQGTGDRRGQGTGECKTAESSEVGNEENRIMICMYENATKVRPLYANQKLIIIKKRIEEELHGF